MEWYPGEALELLREFRPDRSDYSTKTSAEPQVLSENVPAGILASLRARVRAAYDRRACAGRDLNRNQTCSLTSLAARD